MSEKETKKSIVIVILLSILMGGLIYPLMIERAAATATVHKALPPRGELLQISAQGLSNGKVRLQFDYRIDWGKTLCTLRSSPISSPGKPFIYSSMRGKGVGKLVLYVLPEQSYFFKIDNIARKSFYLNSISPGKKKIIYKNVR